MKREKDNIPPSCHFDTKSTSSKRTLPSVSSRTFNVTYIQSNSEYLFHKLRWRDSFCCPHCGSLRISSKDLNHHHCNDCNRTFTDTSNTIFHSTKLPLWKWLVAIYYFIDSPRGISSYTLAKYITVSQPTAWRILHLLRSHLHQQLNLSGEVIIDEVYIGKEWHFVPQYRKMKAIKKLESRKRLENPKWTAPLNKTTLKRLNYQAASEDKMLVVGFRDLNARKLELIHLNTFTRETLLNLLKMRDNGILHITTDESNIYDCLTIPHSKCNHKKGQYKSVDGYSSNPIENHFTHLKRKWHGIYQWWSKPFCQYYLDEFAFRYNHRSLNLLDKFSALFLLIITNADCFTTF